MQASFAQPSGLGLDDLKQTLYIADAGNYLNWQPTAE